jgi:hypothetical protein
MTARVIDDALAATADAPVTLLVQARVMRADAAHALGDDIRAASLLDDVAAMSLGSEDRAELTDELARADELRVALA